MAGIPPPPPLQEIPTLEDVIIETPLENFMRFMEMHAMAPEEVTLQDVMMECFSLLWFDGLMDEYAATSSDELGDNARSCKERIVLLYPNDIDLDLEDTENEATMLIIKTVGDTLIYLGFDYQQWAEESDSESEESELDSDYGSESTADTSEVETDDDDDWESFDEDEE